MHIEPGTRLGNFEVLSELGSGGMGVVYKARDLELGREVAIKLLPESMAGDPEALRRFEQEARAASALNHPNIVTIYEIGEHEGTRYIAMEYVVGVTLRDLLAGGALGNDKLIGYGVQIAQGLAKAHESGIVHRDLKPENIIISEDGYVKILDFGLAKLRPTNVDTESATLALATIPGTILGTVGYMSPEQAGGKSVDFRSDQFSFGAILYEMATGKRAFHRESATQTMTAIIEDEPDPITFSNPSVPRHVVTVVERCLSKEPSERFESTWTLLKEIHEEELTVPPSARSLHPLAAVGVVGALAIILVMLLGLFVPDIREWVSGGETPSSIDSIAVLPFENLSSDPEQDYFAEGMTEALITNLAKVDALRVTSKTSAMRFQGSEQTIPDIARFLDVEAALDGSVLRVGRRVRISVQLVDGATDENIWAESYDRDLENVLVLMSEVAQSIADEIQVAVTPDERARLATARPVSAELQEIYLKARFFMSKLTNDGFRRARELFQQTIDGDPSFAPAHAGLASTEFLLGFFGGEPFPEAQPRSEAAALNAIALDPDLAEAHACLGLVSLYFRWDWDGAERELRRALDLNSTDTFARHGLADILLMRGEPDESIHEVELARQADPLSPMAILPLVYHLVYARRYDQGISAGLAALELLPQYRSAHEPLAIAFWQQGHYEKAIEQYRQSGESSELADVIERGLAEAGPRAAMKAAGDFLAERSRGPISIAAFYAVAGENDRALEWLSKAFEVRLPQLPHIAADPRFDDLRSDARFQDLLRRMNLPS